MGCQKSITEKIVSKGADYFLASKGNQGNLHADVRDFFDNMTKSKKIELSFTKRMAKGTEG
jgi:predicted transposase YbfD/YdcC